MKYLRVRTDVKRTEEINRQRAAFLLSGAYKDDAISEILDTPGEYSTGHSVIKVVVKNSD